MTGAKPDPAIQPVSIVGAGPGDPGLITVKGLAALRSADVVVHDRLISPELLAEARPGARLVYVGKKRNSHTVDQERINALLIEYAKAGLKVCRLKGGDPSMLGRGGEEAEALVAAGIPFELIPGVSSAYSVPEYAGIPVTQRGLASSVAVVTGHEAADKGEAGIDWEHLAKGVSTIVFLMGVKNVGHIAEMLMRHGRDPATPVAMIRWGTTPEQRTLTGTLADIAAEAARAAWRPPSVIVVGEVVRLRDRLAWFEPEASD